MIDTKQYRGRLRLDADGLLWHGRHLLVSALRKVRWAADQADEVLGVADIQVAAIMAVHGAKRSLGTAEADGVIVAPARRVPDLLQALPADPWARAGGLAGRPSPAAVPRRRLTAWPVRRSKPHCCRRNLVLQRHDQHLGSRPRGCRYSDRAPIRSP